jgi:hypothetical protein
MYGTFPKESIHPMLPKPQGSGHGLVCATPSSLHRETAPPRERSFRKGLRYSHYGVGVFLNDRSAQRRLQQFAQLVATDAGRLEDAEKQARLDVTVVDRHCDRVAALRMNLHQKRDVAGHPEHTHRQRRKIAPAASTTWFARRQANRGFARQPLHPVISHSGRNTGMTPELVVARTVGRASR